MAIRYLRNNEIDTSKWDSCIHDSVNGIFYAYSWYLNIVCEDWEALIEGDYETIMPLPVKKRFGIKQVFTPVLINQLGIFSLKPLHPKKIDEFLEAIPAKFKIIHFPLNRLITSNSRQFYKSSPITCFELDLIKSYRNIKKYYSPALLKNLENIERNNISAIEGLSIKSLFEFIRVHHNPKYNIATGEYLLLIKVIIITAIRTRMGEVYGAYSKMNNLIASAFILKSHNKITLIHVCSDKNEHPGALNCIIDYIIQKYSEKNITLSFEYNDKLFNGENYLNFGAIESSIEVIKIVNLPFCLIWLAKFL
ncbi:MAG: hypothetical protein JXJ22_07230 [Bacteroidales bacterium]|nr:hypothetical protein [Bacteroidales bacterium]